MIDGMRGIFFDEDDARAVAARLAGDGYDATVARERLAGEDDDEDHPWAVVTDAPELVMELLVEEFDGWLDLEDPDRLDRREELGRRGSPVQLPTAPKRIKRPD